MNIMSTRATYLFKNKDEWYPDICIYIHHDGYPEGAAYYLHNAFSVKRESAIETVAGYVTAETMIRGNDRAEITRAHEGHGDTEYRYTVTGNQLVAEKGYGDDWKTFYTGDWCDFINQHIDAEWIEGDFQPIKRVDLGYSKGCAHTPKSLQAELDRELKLCGLWSINGNNKCKDGSDSANMRSLKDKIKTMRGLLSSYGEPSWAVQS